MFLVLGDNVRRLGLTAKGTRTFDVIGAGMFRWESGCDERTESGAFEGTIFSLSVDEDVVGLGSFLVDCRLFWNQICYQIR